MKFTLLDFGNTPLPPAVPIPTSETPTQAGAALPPPTLKPMVDAIPSPAPAPPSDLPSATVARRFTAKPPYRRPTEEMDFKALMQEVLAFCPHELRRVFEFAYMTRPEFEAYLYLIRTYPVQDVVNLLRSEFCTKPFFGVPGYRLVLEALSARHLDPGITSGFSDFMDYIRRDKSFMQGNLIGMAFAVARKKSNPNLIIEAWGGRQTYEVGREDWRTSGLLFDLREIGAGRDTAHEVITHNLYSPEIPHRFEPPTLGKLTQTVKYRSWWREDPARDLVYHSIGHYNPLYTEDLERIFAEAGKRVRLNCYLPWGTEPVVSEVLGEFDAWELGRIFYDEALLMQKSRWAPRFFATESRPLLASARDMQAYSFLRKDVFPQFCNRVRAALHDNYPPTSASHILKSIEDIQNRFTILQARSMREADANSIHNCLNHWMVSLINLLDRHEFNDLREVHIQSRRFIAYTDWMLEDDRS